jgi:coenzyme Q-binding protein COQ10
MPKFSDTRILKYSPKQIFELVLDIPSYSSFLPWCGASRVVEKNGEYIIADLVIQYKAFTEKYRSKVITRVVGNDYFIDVEMIEGPFSYLTNKWCLYKVEEGVRIEFDVDFRFKSVFLEKIIGMVFDQAAEKMINAFKKRAEEIYGN